MTKTTHGPIRNIFRAYDVRGLVETEIHQTLAYNLGRALANFWREQQNVNGLPQHVAVGFDARKSSPSLAHALMEGFAAMHWQASSLGMVPTPMVYFATMQSATPFGVMITGSHNPPEFNGFKFSARGASLTSEELQGLYQWLTTHWVDYRNTNARFEVLPLLRTYVDELLLQFRRRTPPKTQKLKVVVDSGSGAAGPLSTLLYRGTGHTIIPLLDEPDALFPVHHPDPSEPKNLVLLQERVQLEGADFGIAFDGDGDRIGVVLQDGTIVAGDQLVLLFATEILERKPGAIIISEVKASQVFFDEITRRGGLPIMWKTGHSFIKSKLKETGAALAGEMSGHLFFADQYYGYDDALYAGLRLIEWAQVPGRSISAFLKSLPETFATPEIRVDCPDHLKFSVVERTAKHFQKTHKVLTLDGARISFPDEKGWGLVRASNTQPALVLRFEANSEKNLLRIKTEVERELHTHLAP